MRISSSRMKQRPTRSAMSLVLRERSVLPSPTEVTPASMVMTAATKVRAMTTANGCVNMTGAYRWNPRDARGGL